MGAHSFIGLGDEFFYAYREGYFPEFAAIFRDDELRDEGNEYAYVLPAHQMRERLDVLGFSVKRARQEKERAQSEIEEEGEAVESFDEWLSELIDGVQGDGPGPSTDVPEWLGWAVDPRLVLRLVLEASPPNVDVALRLEDVVRRGFVRPKEDFCARAFEDQHGSESLTGPLIVMTEGSTDAEFLEQSLRVLDPHLTMYMRFLDYDFKPEGSTSALVRAVKAFAAAGVSNRVVALFDRDAAAAEALTTLPRSLPTNFRIKQLPPLHLASDYPTVGPAGNTQMDVNGLAVSTEMFFGEDVLRNEDGDLTPIQWTSYIHKVQAYQGEVMNKRELQKRFRERANATIARGQPAAGEDWSGMRAILDELKTAFHALS